MCRFFKKKKYSKETTVSSVSADGIDFHVLFGSVNIQLSLA